MLPPLSNQRNRSNRYRLLSCYAKIDLLVTAGKTGMHSPCSLIFYYFIPAGALRIRARPALSGTLQCNPVHEHKYMGNYAKTKSSSRPSGLLTGLLLTPNLPPLFFHCFSITFALFPPFWLLQDITIHILWLYCIPAYWPVNKFTA